MGLWPKRASESVTDLRASLDNPETFPTGRLYEFKSLDGFDVAGSYEAPVSRALAMSVPAVHRGVTLLTTTVSGLDLERIDPSGKRVDLGWLEQPEPGRPRYATFTDIGTDIIFDSASYLRVWDRASNGAPKMGGCEYLDISRVSHVIEPDGRPGVLVDGKPVPRADIIGFEGWHNGIRRDGARTIRTALALEAAARRYADSPSPSVVLVNTSGYEMTDAEIDDLIAGYVRSRNQSGVGYANGGVDPKAIGFDAAQLQLVEARAFVNAQLANLIGVPAHLIAGASSMSGSNLTYANVAQENRAFVDYGIKPLVRALESRLSMSDVTGRAWDNQVTPRGTVIRFELDGLLRGNPLERAQLYAQLIPLGVLTIEEAREMEDLAPTGGQQA